ncbi:MAG TPA: SpoIID/LytB domain-containing protein [Gaiellaceae bacterium]
MPHGETVRAQRLHRRHLRQSITRISSVAAIAVSALALAAGASGEASRGAATGLVVWGHGFGHGIGLSQWGAEGRSEAGQSFQEILSFYYPGATLGSTGDRSVRVLLSEANGFRVGSDAPFTATDADGRRIEFEPGLVRVTSGRLGERLVSLPLRLSPGGAPLQLGGTRYRGTLTFTAADGGAVRAVNTLDLELYVRAVVSSECPGTFGQAALSAQAVASRSYALANLHPERDFDLYPDDRSQNYHGMRRELPGATAATLATRGSVLVYKGSVADTLFSASNGGVTNDGEDSWGPTRLPFVASRPDPFDTNGPAAEWGPVRLTIQRIRDALPVVPADLAGITLVRNAAGRASAVRFVALDGSHVDVPGYQFQQRLGLRSTYFTMAAAFGPALVQASELSTT